MSSVCHFKMDIEFRDYAGSLAGDLVVETIGAVRVSDVIEVNACCV